MLQKKYANRDSSLSLDLCDTSSPNFPLLPFKCPGIFSAGEVRIFFWLDQSVTKNATRNP